MPTTVRAASVQAVYLVPEPRLSRRTVAAGGVSALTVMLSGCASTEQVEPPGLPTTVDGAGADHDLVLAAVVDEQELLGLVGRTRQRHRALRALLADTERTHRSHVDLLAGALETELDRSPPVAVPPGARQALTAVVGAERSLVRKHTATSLAATSGTLARLVAGMAAAAAQQERLLSQAPAPGLKGASA